MFMMMLLKLPEPPPPCMFTFILVKLGYISEFWEARVFLGTVFKLFTGNLWIVELLELKVLITLL